MTGKNLKHAVGSTVGKLYEVVSVEKHTFIWGWKYSFSTGGKSANYSQIPVGSILLVLDDYSPSTRCDVVAHKYKGLFARVTIVLWDNVSYELRWTKVNQFSKWLKEIH